MDASEGTAFKEVRASVFGTAEVEDPGPEDEEQRDEALSPKELKFKRDKVQLKQQTSKERMSSKGAHRGPMQPRGR